MGRYTESRWLLEFSGQLDAARGRIAELEAQNLFLQQRIRTLNVVIVELSLDGHIQRNVIPLR